MLGRHIEASIEIVLHSYRVFFWVAPEPTQEKKTQLSPEKGPERLLTASGSRSNKEGNLLTTMTLTEGDRGSTIPGSRDQPGGNRDPKHAKNGQFSM